ncbi:MAG: DNA translocase FtsK 4TM domain-containing protein [Chlamydiota bacterium]
MKKSKKHKHKTAKKTKKKPEAPKSPPKPQPEAQGFVLFTFALALLISLFSFAYSPGSTNTLGLVGHTIGKILYAILGFSSYILCGFIGWVGWRLLFSKPVNYPVRKFFYVMMMVISVSMLLSLLEDRYPYIGRSLGRAFYTDEWNRGTYYHLGGAPFFYIYHDLPKYNLYRILNTFGVGIFFTGTLFTSVMLLTKIHPRAILEKLQTLYYRFKETFPKSKETFTDYVVEANIPGKASRFVKLKTSVSEEAPKKGYKTAKHDLLEIQPETNLKERPSVSRKKEEQLKPSFPFDFPSSKQEEIKPDSTSPSMEKKVAKKLSSATKRARALEVQAVYNGDFENFKIPNTNLLQSPEKVDQTSLKKNLKRQAEVLEETLLSFGIEAKVGQINCGPSINSFEVHPAIGVKVQKIKALENDIALNMEAKSIRIIAPIPGKAAVGIEIPNPQPQEVGFKDMLNAYQKGGKKFHIPILLGKSVSGEYVMSDLAKMPHCIIAGATGSGKSVCINTIVMSILMNTKPDEIKLIMVDPKKVELTPYSNLPHMLAPVITEPQGACAALMWLVKEMESRYELLKMVGVRNIASFNSRKIDKEAEEALNREIPEKMHYIVGIIDELADLMMVASSDIETPIARIAQMARAVGIHLILATQRPSREVITGLIKANFPTRISFKVASRVNSQIVLDETGAETLLGNGDMLFLPPGTSHLLRAQGAFVRDEDINKVVEHICEQAPPNYVIQSFDTMSDFGDFDLDDSKDAPKDSLYNDALDIVMSTGNASTTFIQRKLKVGYARAASLIDELEERGVIGPAEGSKSRKVIRPSESSSENSFHKDELLDLDEIEGEVKV